MDAAVQTDLVGSRVLPECRPAQVRIRSLRADHRRHPRLQSYLARQIASMQIGREGLNGDVCQTISVTGKVRPLGLLIISLRLL